MPRATTISHIYSTSQEFGKNGEAEELDFGGEIAPIVVAEMVPGEDSQRLDTCVDRELSEDGLEFGLTDLISSPPIKARLYAVQSVQKIIPIARCSNLTRNSVWIASHETSRALDSSHAWGYDIAAARGAGPQHSRDAGPLTGQPGRFRLPFFIKVGGIPW